MQHDKSYFGAEKNSAIESTQSENHVGQEGTRTQNRDDSCKKTDKFGPEESGCDGDQEESHDVEEDVPGEYCQLEEVGSSSVRDENRGETTYGNFSRTQNWENKKDRFKENREISLETQVRFTDIDVFNYVLGNEEFPYKKDDVFVAFCERKRKKAADKKNGCGQPGSKRALCFFRSIKCCRIKRGSKEDDNIMMRMKQIEVCLAGISERVDRLVVSKKKGFNFCKKHPRRETSLTLSDGCDHNCAGSLSCGVDSATDRHGSVLSNADGNTDVPHQAKEGQNDARRDTSETSSQTDGPKTVRINTGWNYGHYSGYRGSDNSLQEPSRITWTDSLDDSSFMSVSEDLIRKICDCNRGNSEEYRCDGSLDDYLTWQDVFVDSRQTAISNGSYRFGSYRNDMARNLRKSNYGLRSRKLSTRKNCNN